jgi:hypothetical protein
MDEILEELDTLSEQLQSFDERLSYLEDGTENRIWLYPYPIDPATFMFVASDTRPSIGLVYIIKINEE